MTVSRIAMIGTRGHHARVLEEIGRIPALRIVGACDGGDSVDGIAKWCAERGHTPKRYGDDHRAMLDELRPDMVVVCGPFEKHAQMCIDSIERGIHVLTEKPAALTMDELGQLRQTCERHANIHLAGLMFSRYVPGFYTAHGLVRSGAIGEIRLINARKSYKLGTRPSYYHDRSTYGGTIPWVASHAIDWVIWIAQRSVTSVHAMHSSRSNGGNGTMEMSALCQFLLQDEIAASVSIDYFRPVRAPTHGDDWIRIVGTRGVLEARPDAVNLINDESDGSIALPVGCERKLVADFVDHVEGRRTALISAGSTLTLTEACLRARESADQGRIVTF